MTTILKNIWRYPLKSHGREELRQIFLSVNRTIPWDRCWAIAHEQSSADNRSWSPCINFSRGSKTPQLMAIDAKLNETTEELTLTHPNLPTITVNPDDDMEELVDWAGSLVQPERAKSARIIRVPKRGMTDTDYPSISINNLASHREVEKQINAKLDPRRWRGNFWIDNLDPWKEFDWVGKKVRLGESELEIREPIQRCLATTANPMTGERDADTLGALNSWEHQNFGVYGVVTKDGKVKIDDAISLIC